MIPEAPNTFINYLGGDFKLGRHKSSVNAHAARRKHAHKRRDRKRSHSDSDVSILAQSILLSDDKKTKKILCTDIDEDELSGGIHCTDLIQAGPPVSLSPYYNFFHLLLPPAFSGISIPVKALVPESVSCKEIRKFAYLNSIYYHQVVSYLFDADSIFLRQVDQCIDNMQRFSYAVCALIQLMQHWTVQENTDVPSYVLENAARAMSRIRISLHDEDTAKDEMVLLELTGLAFLTHLLKQSEALGLHCKLLLHLVKQRGGFAALDNIDLAQVICQTTSRCKDLSHDVAMQPVFKHDLVSSDHIVQASFLSEMNELIANLPIGFQNLSHQTPISIRALRVLHRATLLARAMDPDVHLAKHNQFPKTYSSFVNGAPAMVRPDNGSPSCEKLLDLAITLYARVGWGRRPASNRLFLSSRVDLISAVKLFDVRSEAHKELLIWVWVVTIDAWHMNTDVLAPTGQELLCDLMTRYPETKNFAHVQTLLEKFLWTSERSRFCSVYCQDQGDEDRGTILEEQSKVSQKRNADPEEENVDFASPVEPRPSGDPRLWRSIQVLTETAASMNARWSPPMAKNGVLACDAVLKNLLALQSAEQIILFLLKI